MGLILDSSVVIAAERRGDTVAAMLKQIVAATSDQRAVLSAVGLTELCGGARVVYIWRNQRFPVFLIAVFPKNEKENLSMAERNALRTRANSIFEGIS
jgi:hypothetical protein